MRRDDWVERLTACVEACAAKPFDYGSHNCGLFAAECIDAIVEGSARVAELQAQFSDEATAKAFVDAAGGMKAAISARLGESQPWHRKHQRGDIAIVASALGPAIGVIMGSQIALITREDGLTHYPIDQALCVWRVD